MMKKMMLIMLAAVICLGPAGAALKAEAATLSGEYISTDEAAYYWKYRADSFEPSALYGVFGPLAGSGNRLVKRIKDGTETVLYQGSGFGKIRMSGDRFYLTGTTPDPQIYGGYGADIYSVDKEGKNRKDYGAGSILDIDEESGTLIGASADYKDTLFLIDCAAGSRTELCENAMYLGCQEGYVYYEDCSHPGALTVMKANAAGGQKETVLSVPGYAKQNCLDEYSSISYAKILAAQLLDGYLYFNYGTIAGTAMLYQEGVIARVGLDGSGYQLIAGAEVSKNQWLYAAADENGGITVYTGGMGDSSGDSNIAISMKDMKIRPAAEARGSLGQILTENDTAYFYPKADNQKVVIAADERLASGYTEEYFCIRDAQIAGDYIYYVTEHSIHEPDGDIGWRYCYRRRETVLQRRPLGGGETQTLYRY